LSVLDFVFIIAGLTALVTLPFLIFAWSNYLGSLPQNRTFPIRSVAFFVGSIVVALCTASISQSLAQGSVLDALDVCSPSNSTVLINGREVPNGVEVLSTLRELRGRSPHHSSATQSFTVEVRGPSHIILRVARDSGDPHEYWVFLPKYWITRYNEIGRLVTPIFDPY
jgi:hypothetical protein